MREGKNRGYEGEQKERERERESKTLNTLNRLCNIRRGQRRSGLGFDFEVDIVVHQMIDGLSNTTQHTAHSTASESSCQAKTNNNTKKRQQIRCAYPSLICSEVKFSLLHDIADHQNEALVGVAPRHDLSVVEPLQHNLRLRLSHTTMRQHNTSILFRRNSVRPRHAAVVGTFFSGCMNTTASLVTASVRGDG